MGNDASKQQQQQQQDPDDNSNYSDFQPISHPNSPEHIPTPADEMSYSGILVEKPGDNGASPSSSSPGLTSSFSTPLAGKQSAASASVNPNRRRIIKATPPPAPAVVPLSSSSSSSAAAAGSTTTTRKGDDDDDENYIGHQKNHLPAVLSPKASKELLQESMEQSKTKRLEKLSREQKLKRDKLLEERRKTHVKKEGATQPNPFTKFLKAFSVEPAFPHHKRAYEEGDIDREEATASATAAASESTAKTGPSSSSSSSTPLLSGRISPAVVMPHNDSKRMKLDESSTTGGAGTTDKDGYSSSNNNNKLLLLSSSVASWAKESVPEWVPMAVGATAMAAVAVMIAFRLTSNGGSKS
jgi:hypothetical protein